MGAKVAISARKQSELDTASSYLTAKGIDVLTIVNDLGDAASRPDEQLVSNVLDRFGAVDILINNAGMVWGGAATDLTPENWSKVMALNVDACFRVAQTVARKSMIHESQARLSTSPRLRDLAVPGRTAIFSRWPITPAKARSSH